MTDHSDLERALAHLTGQLERAGQDFALVGGLAISVRGGVRFTRDIDVAVAVADDAEAEALVFLFGGAGYTPRALVEHDTQERLATARLRSPAGVTTDLIFATSGIESEIVARASRVDLPDLCSLPVASPEELLATKILSMTERRPQDKADALWLLERVPDLDMDRVHQNIARISERGYDRGEDLEAKLQELLAVLDHEGAD